MIAAIGSDGHTPIVYGLGATEEAAIMDTTICTVTEYGSSGPYLLGIEYAVDGHTCRAIRRPILQERFLGYGLEGDYGSAVVVLAHDGALTEWRTGPIGGPLRACIAPRTPPYLNLPNDEHGWSWGEPLDIPSMEASVYRFEGREVTEAEARRLLEAYEAAHPEIAEARSSWA